jgi:hypothetical protein
MKGGLQKCMICLMSTMHSCEMNEIWILHFEEMLHDGC